MASTLFTTDPFQLYMIETLGAIQADVASLKTNNTAIHDRVNKIEKLAERTSGKVTFYSGGAVVIAFLIGTIRDFLFHK